MKKILSLLTVVAVMFTSVVVNAAFSVEEYYGDEFLMISPVETGADVLARTPRLSVVSTETITDSDASEAGINLGSGRSKMSNANTDFYKVTYKIDNIGDLYVAYSDATDYVHSVKIINVAITLAGLTTKGAVSSSTFGGVAWTIASNQMQWTCGANSNAAYPTTLNTSSGERVSDTEMNFVVTYAVAKDTTYNAAPSMTFTYGQREGAYDEGLEGYAWGDTESRDVVIAGANNLVFPPEEESTTTYTIVFQDWNGSPLGSDTYDEGATVTAPVPSREGYTFTGWSPAFSETATADVTYVAQYVEATPADVLPTTFKAYNKGATDNTDVKGNSVGEYTYNYGAAKFNNVTIEDSKYIYKLIAKSGELESDPIAIGTGNIEVQGTMSFMAIIKSATKAITGIVLRAIAK